MFTNVHIRLFILLSFLTPKLFEVGKKQKQEFACWVCMKMKSVIFLLVTSSLLSASLSLFLVVFRTIISLPRASVSPFLPQAWFHLPRHAVLESSLSSGIFLFDYSRHWPHTAFVLHWFQYWDASQSFYQGIAKHLREKGHDVLRMLHYNHQVLLLVYVLKFRNMFPS